MDSVVFNQISIKNQTFAEINETLANINPNDVLNFAIFFVCYDS